MMRLSASCVAVVLFLCSIGLAGAVQDGDYSSSILLPGQPKYYYNNYETLMKLFSYTTWPNQVPICANTSNLPPALFKIISDQLEGRVSPIGNFTNAKESCEYLFCLAPQPYNEPAGVGLDPVEGIQYSCSCPEVAILNLRAPMRVRRDGDPNYGKLVGYIYFNGAYRFDKKGRVLAFDANLPAFYSTMQLLLGNTDDPLVQELYRVELCNVTQQVCTGKNAQYADGLDCVGKLAYKRFGTFADAWSDTIACRLLHMFLAEFDPDTHCPHLSFGGGMKCVDYPFDDKYVNSNKALFGGDHYFVCPKRADDAPASEGEREGKIVVL